MLIANTAVQMLKNNKATICFVGGVISTGAGIVSTIKHSFRFKEELDEYKATKTSIQNDNDITEDEKKKAIKKEQKKIVFQAVKEYSVPVSLLTLGMTGFTSSFIVQTKEIGKYAAALSVSQEMLNTYRQSVTEKIGKEAEEEIYSEVSDTVNGKKKTEEENATEYDDRHRQYTKSIPVDPTIMCCKNTRNRPWELYCKLQSVERDLNDIIINDAKTSDDGIGYMSLSQIKNHPALMAPKTSADAQWVIRYKYDPANKKPIDLGLNKVGMMNIANGKSMEGTMDIAGFIHVSQIRDYDVIKEEAKDERNDAEFMNDVIIDTQR